MSYTPTEWKTGDVITADKLNNIEDGIAGAGAEVTFVKFFENINVTFADHPTSIFGGGPFKDNKKLGELIGDKTIIGYCSMLVCGSNHFYPPATMLQFPLAYQTTMLESLNNATYIILLEPEREGSGGNMYGSSGVLNIFAICI